MGASKTFAMPWLVLVSHASSSNNLIAFDASSSKLFFITPSTINVAFTRDERFGANWSLTNAAAEAFFMPLTTLVFHLLGSCTENFTTSITAGSKSSVIAISAVNLFSFRSKRFVYQ